jgi:hypothetical protein
LDSQLETLQLTRIEIKVNLFQCQCGCATAEDALTKVRATLSMAPNVLGGESRSMSADHLDQLSGALPQRDRRRRYRARVHWPVQFEARDASDLSPTETQNISSDGFYCRTKAVFAPGELVACTLLVPAHHPQASEGMLAVKCQVRIVRVEESDSQGFHGIACRIEDYQFPSTESAASDPPIS